MTHLGLIVLQRISCSPANKDRAPERPQFPCAFDPGHDWHLIIQENHVVLRIRYFPEMPLSDHFECEFSVFSLIRLMTHFLQHSRKHRARHQYANERRGPGLERRLPAHQLPRHTRNGKLPM